MTHMENNELLLRLLYRAFIDIRLASNSGDTRTSGSLSNLLHNIPLAMINSDGNEVLEKLTERAQMLGMSSWLRVALSDILPANESSGSEKGAQLGSKGS